MKFRQRRAAQIGVQHDARRINHSPQGWRFQAGKILFHPGLDRIRVGPLVAAADLLANRLQHPPYFVHDQTPRKAPFQPRQIREYVVYRGQIPQLFIGGQVTMLS